MGSVGWDVRASFYKNCNMGKNILANVNCVFNHTCLLTTDFSNYSFLVMSWQVMCQRYYLPYTLFTQRPSLGWWAEQSSSAQPFLSSVSYNTRKRWVFPYSAQTLFKFWNETFEQFLDHWAWYNERSIISFSDLDEFIIGSYSSNPSDA